MRRVLIVLVSQLSAVIGYAQSIGISEFMYHADTSAQSNDWVELYNYGNAAVNISGWKLKDENIDNTFTIPGGTVIEPGAYLVIAESLDTFQMIYPDVTNVIGSMDFGLNNKADAVRLLDASNNPIVEINYFDSLPWPGAADGMGPSLQIADFDAGSDDPANWFAGCIKGTPGSAYVPCDYPVIVSEINYNSPSYFLVGDWIELYNRSGNSVDLSGWEFHDQKRNIFIFPSGTILNDGERLVVSDSLTALTSGFPGLENVIGEFTFSLSNGGDAVLLYDDGFALQYSVRYNDKSPWPLDADGEGYTLEFMEESDNPNLAANWQAGCPLGSPGIPFTYPCPTLDAESLPLTAIAVYPNPFTDYLSIDLSSYSPGYFTQCYITDLTGRTVATMDMNSPLIVWKNTLSNGMYLLHIVGRDGAVFTEKLSAIN